jgi:hypothetical protein
MEELFILIETLFTQIHLTASFIKIPLQKVLQLIFGDTQYIRILNLVYLKIMLQNNLTNRRFYIP